MTMALVNLIEYRDAGPEVREVYDDIMKTRGTDWINNFWKALANDPRELRRVWRNVKEVMAPGALDPLRRWSTLRSAQPTGASTAPVPIRRRRARRA